MKFIEKNVTKETRKGSCALRNTATGLAAFLVLLASSGAGGAAWGTPPLARKHAKEGVVRNYAVVWPGKVMRSGKPYSQDGWTWVHQQGVKSIVTLIRGDKVDYKKYGFENVLYIPLQGQEVPTEEEAKQYLQFIQDPKEWPVDVHCAEGKDRTGMMVALARYAIDGWSMEQALAEATTYRGGKPLAPFRVEWLQKWAATHKPSSERSAGSGGE